MAVRVKELVIRYEDDGQDSGHDSALSADELAKKYRPLKLTIYHHTAPPPLSATLSHEEGEEGGREYKVDLSRPDKS
jgi:hypothetical protein